jgi:hypothetical protein
MQHLCFRYTHGSTADKEGGASIQGRYKAIVVDADVYLAELVRYIHLNPVRAKLVKESKKYRWSGHKAYMGQETLPWLTTEWVLSQFGRRLKTARARYGEFVHIGRKEGHRQEFHEGTSGGRILGDDSFVERAYEKSELSEDKSETLDEIIERVGKEYGLTEEEMSARGRQRHPAEARGMIAYLVREATGLSMTELARRMKRDVSTLSLAADKIMRRSNYQNKGRG